jgi:protein SCO1/2
MTEDGVSRPAARSGGVSLFEKPWLWEDERGAVVALSKWRGTPEIVTMFYASCTFRCPLTLAKLKRLEAAFAKRASPVHFVLITLDPRADTPDRLRDFKRSEHLADDTWHLLAGDDGDTKELSRILGVRPSHGDSHIDHDVKIAVVDANGLLLQTLDGWHFDEDAVVAAEALPQEAHGRPRSDPAP